MIRNRIDSRKRAVGRLGCGRLLRAGLLGLAGLGVVACGKRGGGGEGGAGAGVERVQAVEVAEVEEMTLEETVGLIGTIAANESAELRSELAGTIESIHFDEGRPLKKGDLLVKLDTRELDALLEETRAGFLLAEQNLKRAQGLLNSRAISKQDADAALAEHNKLHAAVNLLEVKLAKSSISAPFDGVAGARAVSVGDFVSSQSVITTVDDLARLKVEMTVPERYLPKLKPGGAFSLRTATSPDGAQVAGTVYFVSPRIDEATRSTLVKGYVENPPAHLKPGMFANITLVLNTIDKALVVPETALLATPKGTVVVAAVDKDGATVAEFIPVRAGLRTPGRVQVTPTGPPLKAGDRVVSAGVGGLFILPGATLKPVTPVVTPEPLEKTQRRL